MSISSVISISDKSKFDISSLVYLFTSNKSVTFKFTVEFKYDFTTTLLNPTDENIVLVNADTELINNAIKIF